MKTEQSPYLSFPRYAVFQNDDRDGWHVWDYARRAYAFECRTMEDAQAMLAKCLKHPGAMTADEARALENYQLRSLIDAWLAEDDARGESTLIRRHEYALVGLNA